MKLRKWNRVAILTLLSSFSFACVAHAGPGGFVYTGSMSSARNGHTATPLNNGMVLITGGDNAFSPRAELYNPSTGTFAFTGTPSGRSFGHTATLLTNGMVLITGGYSSRTGTVLSSAELYNPSTGTFTFTGNLNTARENHTATLLDNGMVLIAGGFAPASCPRGVGCSASYFSSAELYNPSTGTFSATGSMNTARNNHRAIRLNNGMVLIVGGGGPSGLLSSAELYNSSTGTFSATGSMNTPRTQHTATLLNDGTVLIAGDGTPRTAELYNPVTGTFSFTGSMNVARRYHRAALLNNGMVLIAGGVDSSSLSSAEIYSPSTGTFSATGSMNTARNSHTETLLNNGMVLIAGGWNTGSLSSAELYQPTGPTSADLLSIALSPINPWVPLGSSLGFTATGTFSGGGTQILASATWSSSNSAVATITSDESNRGHAYGLSAGSATITACAGSICGSTTVTVAPHSNLILGSVCGDASGGTFEIYDDAGGLKQTGNFSTLVLANQSATVLQNGTVFVAGGNGFNCTGSSATWEIISPSGQILSSGLLQNGRSSSAVTLLQNGNVFLAGGQASPTNLDGTWEIRSPAGAFVASGLLNDVRGPGVTAVALQNGNVWVSGSTLNTGSACTYEIHSPTGALVASGSLQSCFAGAQVQALNNGNLMLLGGDNAPGTYEIRTQAGAFVSTGSLTSSFNDGASSVLLNNGNVLILGSCMAGGDAASKDQPNPPFTCPNIGSPSTWEVRDQNGNFVRTGSLFNQRTGAGVALLSNGNIFITGGSLCASCWEIWTQNGQFVSLGSLFNTRYGGHSLTHF